MEEIYSFHTDYCPYIKRKLCSLKDLYEWYLEIDRYFFHDANDFIIWKGISVSNNYSKISFYHFRSNKRHL